MNMGTLLRRLRLFIRRDTAALDLHEEMRLHLELRAERLGNAGVARDAAVDQAQRQFGNRTTIAEEARAMSGLSWLEHACTTSSRCGNASATGARASNPVALVIAELTSIVVAGVAVGLVGAWMLSKLVSSLLYGISPHDPMTFVAVPLALLVAAAVAALIPAHHAATVDPATLLGAD